MTTLQDVEKEIEFISGLNADGTVAAKSFLNWNNDTPATYNANSTTTSKWGATTAGTASGTVYYYFDPASNWTATEESALEAGLALWSAEANLTFVETTDATQAKSGITFKRGTDGSAYESSTYSGTSKAAPGSSVLRETKSAVISIDTSVPGFGPITGSFSSYGGYVWDTIVHEEGHAIGLGHGGPYNGSGENKAQLGVYDMRLWSLMSYVDPDATKAKYYKQYTVKGTDWGVSSDGYGNDPTTTMDLDILSAQRLYGLPTTTPLGGGQTFGFNCNIVGPVEQFFDFTKNTTPVITLWDEGTGNTLDLSGFSKADNIDLDPGAFSSCDGMVNNIGIAFGTAIDSLVCGVGADIVVANNDGNTINGGSGNDTITGGTGADDIIGGNGNDMLVGGAGNDTISGGKGNDKITGGTGTNTINGGAGTDTLFLSGKQADYTVTHHKNGTTTVTGDGETDTLTSVEKLQFSDATIKTNGKPLTAAAPAATDLAAIWSVPASSLAMPQMTHVSALVASRLSNWHVAAG